MTWIDSRKKLPEVGQEVLIHCQGYGMPGNYWTRYETATLIRPPRDRRRKVFAQTVSINESCPWEYRGVIYWTPFPDPPPVCDKEEYMIKAGYFEGGDHEQ